MMILFLTSWIAVQRSNIASANSSELPLTLEFYTTEDASLSPMFSNTRLLNETSSSGLTSPKAEEMFTANQISATTQTGSSELQSITSLIFDSHTSVHAVGNVSKNITGASVATITTNTTFTNTTGVPLITQVALNMSSAYDSYWVKTVIEVRNLSVSVTSSYFVSLMEYRLATVYSLAMQMNAGMQNISSKRRRRAVTYGNATIQMTNVTTDSTSVQLVYYLVEYYSTVNGSSLTAATSACALMDLVPTQQVTSMLGFVVLTQCELYVSPPASNLWIIGAVIGGVAFILFLVWFSLFCYYKCTRAPKRLIKRTPFWLMQVPPTNITPVADFEQQVMEKDFTDLEVKMQDSTNLQTPKKIKKRKRKSPKRLDGQQNSADFQPNNADSEIVSDSAAHDGPPGTFFVRPAAETESGNVTYQVDNLVDHTEVNQRSSPAPPKHTPLYINSTWRQPLVPPWNPYLAADIAAQILRSSDSSRHDSTDPSSKFTDSTLGSTREEEHTTNVDAVWNSVVSGTRNPSSTTSLSDNLPRSSAQQVSIADVIRYEYQLLFSPPLNATSSS